MEAAKEDTDYFVILLKATTGRLQFRALYWHDGKGGLGHIYSPLDAPDVLDQSMIKKFFRYDSGGRRFIELTDMKSIHHKVDAVTIVERARKRPAI